MLNLKRRLKHIFNIQDKQVFPATYCNTTVIHPEARILNSSSPSKIAVGARSHIHGVLMVWNNCGEIKIGHDSFIGQGTRVYSAGSIIVGDRVQIAHNCNIFDNNVHSLDPRERHLEFMENTTQGLNAIFDLKASFVKIEDDVWVGASSIILKGVTIGRAAIVGAGSVVVNDVPAGVVVVGNPARVVKRLDLP